MKKLILSIWMSALAATAPAEPLNIGGRAATSGTADVALLLSASTTVPIAQIDGLQILLDSKVSGTNFQTFSDAVTSALSGKSSTSHAETHTAAGSDPLALDAAQITSGTLDVARIPVLPSQTIQVSTGDLTVLTTAQQTAIGKGTVVTTTDGNRWVYTGTGSKTASASYIQLADITPDWSTIANRPSLGGAALLNVGTAAGTVAAGDDSRFGNAAALTTGTVPTSRLPAASATNSGILSFSQIPWETVGATSRVRHIFLPSVTSTVSGGTFTAGGGGISLTGGTGANNYVRSILSSSVTMLSWWSGYHMLVNKPFGFGFTVAQRGWGSDSTTCVQFGGVGATPPAMLSGTQIGFGIQLAAPPNYGGDSKIYAGNGTSVTYSGSIAGNQSTTMSYIVWWDGAGNISLFQAQFGDRYALAATISGGPTTGSWPAENLEIFVLTDADGGNSVAGLVLYDVFLVSGVTPTN